MTEPAAKRTVERMDIEGILHAIPHRYPFLMIDRLVDVVPGESATGIKNVSIGEAFFQGHFPRRPIMPGVLIVEAMAQTSAVLVVETLGPATRASSSTSCCSRTAASAGPSCRAIGFSSM